MLNSKVIKDFYIYSYSIIDFDVDFTEGMTKGGVDDGSKALTTSSNIPFLIYF